MTKSPILLVIFNRLETTKLVFDKIRQAKPQKLYIASDGARSNVQGEVDNVHRVRNYVLDNISWPCRVYTLFSEQNQGCGIAVSSAISWLFSNEEFGIILEDDCIPSLSFFRYCDEILDWHKNNSEVFMVSGDNFLFDKSSNMFSYSFSKYQLIWGWATWKRAWAYFDSSLSAWPTFKQSHLFKTLTPEIDERHFWTSIFDKMYYDQPSDIWDYQWLHSMWLNGGLCVYPNTNLISNVGFGQNATHTSIMNKCSAVPALEMEFPILHPPHIAQNTKGDSIICTNFYLYRRGWKYFLWVQLRKIKKMANGIQKRFM